MQLPVRSVVGLIAGLALLAGCTSTVGSQRHSGDTIRLGVNAELTGDLAPYGDAMAKGVQVAVDQTNAAGGVHGHQIELFTADNRGDAGKTVAMATTLMSQQRALAVIGPVSDGLFALTLPVADRHQIPVISGSACDSNRLNDANGTVHQFAFRSCLGLGQQGAAMASFAKTNLSASSAAVFRTGQQGFANEFADAFVSGFAAAGGTLGVQDSFEPGETDYTRFVTALQADPADVIYVAAPLPETATMIRTLRGAGIDQPILGTGDLGTPLANEVAGPDALTKVYVVTQFSGQDTGNKVAQRFLDAYRQTYGADPDAHAAMAYDAALLAIAGIAQADELTGIDVQSAIESTRGVDGAGGRFSIGDDHQVSKDALVVELAGGVPVSLAHIGGG